jgi:hypothetical protein
MAVIIFTNTANENTFTVANDQLDAQIFNTFTTIPYMYMFRAICFSSSGGQIVLIQHLVSSLSVSDRCTGRSLTEFQYTKNIKDPGFARYTSSCSIVVWNAWSLIFTLSVHVSGTALRYGGNIILRLYYFPCIA